MKNIFSKTTEKRTQNGVKTDSKRTNYGIPILIFAFLTLGFGQAWGAVGFESSDCGIKYSHNGGSDTEWNFSGQSAQTKTLTGNTSSLWLKQWFSKMYQNEDGTIYGKDYHKFVYKIHRTAASAGTTGFTTLDANWWDWGNWDGGGYRRPKGGHNNENINLLDGLGSGKYTMTFYFQHNGNSTYKSTQNTLKWTYNIVPDVSSFAVTPNNVVSGTGTSVDPYIITYGQDMTLTVSGTKASTDANSSLYAKFGSNDYSATLTKTYAVSTTLQNVTVKAKYYNSDDDLSGTEQSTTIYYKTVLTPSIGLSAPSSAVRGDAITLTASISNASTPTIVYQYSTNSTFASSVTDIASTTSTTQSWTVPAGTSGTTYYLRAKMTISSTTYYSPILTLTAYGKKTLHVKNREGWAEMYLYAGDGNTGAWPGTTSSGSNGFSISREGTSQWYTVVITSANSIFILNKGTSGAGNQTADLSYSSYSNGGYYECYNHSGSTVDGRADGQLYNSSAPAAPSATTNEATVNSATSLTFNYSVGANRDRTTPGIAYIQSDSNIDDPATIYSSGTHYDGGAIDDGNVSGTISNKTITAGKDYYYVAYGINGFGTTYGSILKIRTTSITLNKKGGDSGNGNFVAVGGKTISAITAPSKTGYTFAGYWTSENDESGTKYYNANGSAAVASWPTNLSASLTLYAHWTPNKYDVTLKLNGGTGTDNQVVQAIYDATMPLVIKTAETAIVIPTKTGYTLLGYWDATSGGNQYYAYNGSLSSSRTWNKTSNAYLYARWQANTYTLTLYKNDGSATSSSATATYDATISATPPTRTGYTFTGYWTAASGGTKIIDTDGHFVNTVVSGYVASNRKWQRTSDTDLHAQWTVNTYTITLNAGTGGSGSGTATIDYDATGYKTWSHDITQTGYHINGWYDNGEKLKVLNDNGTFAASDVTGYITSGKWSKASNCTLQAWWDPNNYTVTLDVNEDHKGNITGATTIHTVTFNTVTNTVPNRPTAEQGYGLDGYYTGQNGEGTKVINGDGTFIASVDGYTDGTKKWIRDGGVTLYAYYKKAEITNLTFDAAVVAPSASVGVTPTVAPTPEGTNSICWKLLYNNGNLYTPQPTFSPENPGGVGNKVTFNAPPSSGMYLLAAVLRTGSSCDGGTKLDSVTYPFQVAGDHTVTMQYKCGNTTIAASTTTIGRPLVWSSAIAAPEIFGYTFHHWLAGDGITLSEDGINAKTGERADSSVVSSIYIKAIYDGKLTAVYTQENIIYFKDNLGWTDPADPDAHVYVNLLTTDKWTDNKGTGNSGVTDRNLTMNRVEGTTDIFYYNYGNKSVTYVSFTKERMDGYDYFYQESPNVAHVVFPTRYADALTTNKVSEAGFKAMTPMFVPLEGQTGIKQNNDRADYYNRGYWTMYTPGTGYTLEIYNEYGNSLLKSIAFTSEDDLMPMKAVADLEAGHNYKYQIRRGGTGSDGIYYGNSGTMTYKNHGQSTAWDMSNPPSFSMAGIEANASGDYIFHLSYSTYGDVDAYRLRIAVDYPIAGGDYRVIYKDDVHRSYKPSAIVTNANYAKDTVSFFIRHNQNPSMKIQQATVDGETGAITWNDVEGGTVDLSSITQTGVYNICLTMDGSGAISVENKEPYTGNFYIRTDCAVSKWDNYKNADHLMTYSLYSEEHSDFSHYFMGHVYGGTNVKFVVANDYSPCISDTLIVSTYRSGDAAHVWDSDGDGHGAGDLKAAEANIRFMWNRANNAVYRAYLAPAQSDGSNFLVLRGRDSDNLKDENGYPLRNASNSEQDGYNHKAPDHCIQFVDDENWIYEATVQVEPSSYVKLYALFNDDYFYYKGTEDNTFDDSHAIKLVEGSGDAVKVRVIYDFKTDRLVAAYMPSGEISTKMDINADVMFIREHQGDIDQLTFTNDGSITDIKTAYAVMRFNKWTLNNKDKNTHEVLDNPKSIYERSLYYVSFPFPVNLNEVFGFGTYGQHWIIQRYRGDLRAQQGFWAESAGFWEFIWNRNGVVLQPNEGYILTLETELLGVESDVWGPRSVANQVELYFPSTGSLGSITNTSITQEVPAHTCTINRAATEGLPDTSDPSTSYNRTIFDSHWNIMSVPTYVNVNNPSFANTTWIGGGEGNVGPKFLYTWNPDDNTLTATSGTGFVYHAMHAYTVQYYGNVTWTTSVTPTAAPQRNTEYRGEYEFCLEVQQDEQMIDRTFVRLSDDENVTTGFEFGEDMTKQFNSRKANIFTIAGNTSLGGNSLPLSTTQTTVVPVGVSIKSAGDYTFAIPEGTEGIGVTLVDNETGVRTSLSALDYTVTLQPGDYTGRFVLEISPIQNTPTGLEEPTSDSSLKGRAQKVMIDGILYIVKDGKMYDARGARVQ